MVAAGSEGVRRHRAEVVARRRIQTARVPAHQVVREVHVLPAEPLPEFAQRADRLHPELQPRQGQVRDRGERSGLVRLSQLDAGRGAQIRDAPDLVLFGNPRMAT